MMVLPIVALVLATLFTGAALYISLVEHPARLGLDDAALLAQWQPSYQRALPIQASLAIAGGFAGLVSWYQLGDWRWLIGGLALLANWPVTFMLIMPINRRLKAIQPRDANVDSRQMLEKWGTLHNYRSALGVLAMLVFSWVLIAPA